MRSKLHFHDDALDMRIPGTCVLFDKLCTQLVSLWCSHDEYATDVENEALDWQKQTIYRLSDTFSLTAC